MVHFRCYLLSTANNIANSIDFDCDNDRRALRRAKIAAEEAGAVGYELWDGDQKLCAALTRVPVEAIGRLTRRVGSPLADGHSRKRRSHGVATAGGEASLATDDRDAA